LKVKVVILLALALFAFAMPTITTFNLSVRQLYGSSNILTGYDDPPVQPTGDPIDDEGNIPH